MDEHSWNFSVSEIFPDGRVVVTTYVRVEQEITMVMDVYDDQSLTTGKRYLDVHLPKGATLPVMRPASE